MKILKNLIEKIDDNPINFEEEMKQFEPHKFPKNI